jgi:hypothetical protein
MKRKLIKENLNTRANPLRKPLRKGNRSAVDLKALKDVQNQFDNLIGLMTNTKLLLAGLSIGGDEVWAENSASSEWEEGELE